MQELLNLIKPDTKPANVVKMFCVFNDIKYSQLYKILNYKNTRSLTVALNNKFIAKEKVDTLGKIFNVNLYDLLYNR